MEPTRLEGTRVVLRELTPEDYEAVRVFVEDPDVTRHLNLPTKPEQTLAWIAKAAENAASADRRRYDLAIEVDGALVGAFGLGLEELATAEVGWVLRQDTWGRGLATEAAEVMIRHAFEVLEVRRIIARVDIRNKRSARVMEKLFLRREALFARDELATGGGYRSSYLYALLADEWRAISSFPATVRAKGGLEVTLSRPADVTEINDLQRIVGQAMLADFGMDHWSEPYDLAEMQADARRRETFAIRDATGDTVASFTIGLSPMWLSEDTTPWSAADQPLWLHRLMVTPKLQSSGLGSALMGLAETLGRARGCDVIRLETRSDFDAVQRFYARNGYAEVHRHVSERHAPWSAMERRLR